MITQENYFSKRFDKKIQKNFKYFLNYFKENKKKAKKYKKIFFASKIGVFRFLFFCFKKY